MEEVDSLIRKGDALAGELSQIINKGLGKEEEKSLEYIINLIENFENEYNFLINENVILV